MSQFVNTLSSEANNIVWKFLSSQRHRSILVDSCKNLMVSLYSLMPFKNDKVVAILKEYCIQLSDSLSDEEIQILKTEFSSVVKYCYINKNHRGITHIDKTAPLCIPMTLVELCASIASPRKGSSVYLPYANDGSFALTLEDCSVDGFEINPIHWALSQIVMSSMTNSYNIVCGDDLPLRKSYDYIFSFPPLGIKEFNGDILQHLVFDKLNDNGELYCLLPMSFCWDTVKWIKFRQAIARASRTGTKYSVLVIELPKGIIPSLGIKVCLVHIAKDNKGVVALMNASSDVFHVEDRKGSGNIQLKVNSIIESIKENDTKYCWIDTFDNVIEEGVNLTPSRYLVNNYLPVPANDEKLAKLSEVCIIGAEGKRARRLPMSLELYKIVKPNDLSADYLNCNIYANKLEYCKNTIASRFIFEDCLVGCFVNGKFKVGKLNGVSRLTPIVAHYNIFTFKLRDKSSITEEFLLRALMQDSTTKQAEAFACGAVIERLSLSDIRNLTITVPPLEKQHRLCSEDARSRISEASLELIKSQDEFRKDIHMKKHAIGQTLFNLDNWWKTLLLAKKEANGTLVDSAFTGKIRKIQVSSIYESIGRTISQLQQQIDRFDRGNGLEVKPFEVDRFIMDYVQRKQSPLFTFDLKANYVLNEDETILNTEMTFAPEALEMVLDNIVSNACSHGFKGREDKDNIIKISIDYNSDVCVCTISNNGHPLNKNIYPDEVFIYGRSSVMGKDARNDEFHFGLGGYEVGQLMRAFGGNAEFMSTPDSEFPITYKLTIINTKQTRK